MRSAAAKRGQAAGGPPSGRRFRPCRPCRSAQCQGCPGIRTETRLPSTHIRQSSRTTGVDEDGRGLVGLKTRLHAAEDSLGRAEVVRVGTVDGYVVLAGELLELGMVGLVQRALRTSVARVQLLKALEHIRLAAIDGDLGHGVGRSDAIQHRRPDVAWASVSRDQSDSPVAPMKRMERVIETTQEKIKKGDSQSSRKCSSLLNASQLISSRCRQSTSTRC